MTDNSTPPSASETTRLRYDNHDARWLRRDGAHALLGPTWPGAVADYEPADVHQIVGPDGRVANYPLMTPIPGVKTAR